MEQQEVDLIEILNVLWKRRWFILVPTILLALLAGIVSFLLPRKWEVDAIIQPSKLLVQIEGGELKELLVTDPKQLASQINQESYTHLISRELNIPLERFPELKARNPRDTKLVCVSLRTKKPEQGQAILNALFTHLKGELDRKAEVEIRTLATQIALKESDIKQKELDIESINIDIEKTRQEIVTAENNLKISEERSRNIAEEMKGVKVRNDGIEKQQTTALAEKKGGGEALGLLLYSNEIQQNLRYYNALDSSLSEEKNRQENYRLTVRQKEQAIKGFQTQIDKNKQMIVDLRSQIGLLNDKKQRIDYATMVKEPTVSLYPVFPKKMANVAVAGFLGLFCFSMLAIYLNSAEKRTIEGPKGF